MEANRSRLYLLLLAVALGTFLASVALHTLRPDLRWENVGLHSVLEAVGGLAAIIMALFLLLREEEKDRWKLLLLGLGFLGMGLLDGFHGATLPGRGFILLHTAASLFGGFWFALVWLPEPGSYVLWKKWAPWIVVTAAALFGTLWSLFAAELPRMSHHGQFIGAAVAMNATAGVMFVVASARFLLDFRRSSRVESYLFSCLALLFGLAGFLFKLSTLWETTWWLWHLVRLTAYLLALGFVMVGHRRTVSDLKFALAERNRAEHALRKLNEELECQVRERTAELETANRELRCEILERERAQQALRGALDKSERRQAEISALLEGTRAVLQHRDFRLAARAIFDSCKNFIGATAGYVALLSEDGSENEVVFLESGGRSCQVDPSLPMPIRGLRGEAYRTGKVVYENDFSHSEWITFMPEGHVSLDNVLFAPLIIEGKAVGLLGIANKPGGFSDDDARKATAFGELAAIALLNSRMLESLEEHERRFRSVVQTANDGIISIDAHGNIVFWNHAAETMFGYSVEEVVGKPLTLVIPQRFHKAHQDGFQRFLSTGKISTFGTMEVAGVRKDGTEFPIELSIATWRTGEGIFLTGVCRDIAERKRAEEEIHKINAELTATNRELEAFTYSVSHDLRAPLRHVDGFSKLLLEEHSEGLPQEARRYLTLVRDGTRRMGQMVDDLLNLGRVGRKGLSVQLTGLTSLVEEVLRDLKPEMEGREIEWQVGRLPFLECDAALMKQVFVNFFSNALKFTRPRERAVIEVGTTIQNGSPVIFIRDNGVGFSMKYADKLFGVFQRLHRPEDFEGTGVGLATVQRIVHKHGGRVWAEAELNKGATFYFSLGAPEI